MHAQTDNGDDSQGQASKRPCSSQGLSTVEEQKAKAKQYEQKLVELHKDNWTSFQYKLWAEMLVCGTHTSLDEPLSASMFSRVKTRINYYKQLPEWHCNQWYDDNDEQLMPSLGSKASWIHVWLSR